VESMAGSRSTYLADQLLSYFGIRLRSEGLLEEGQENGDDYTRFEAFAEADEEDCGLPSVSTSIIYTRIRAFKGSLCWGRL